MKFTFTEKLNITKGPNLTVTVSHSHSHGLIISSKPSSLLRLSVLRMKTWKVCTSYFAMFPYLPLALIEMSQFVFPLCCYQEKAFRIYSTTSWMSATPFLCNFHFDVNVKIKNLVVKQEQSLHEMFCQNKIWNYSGLGIFTDQPAF